MLKNLHFDSNKMITSRTGNITSLKGEKRKEKRDQKKGKKKGTCPKIRNKMNLEGVPKII